MRFPRYIGELLCLQVMYIVLKTNTIFSQANFALHFLQKIMFYNQIRFDVITEDHPNKNPGISF